MWRGATPECLMGELIVLRSTLNEPKSPSVDEKNIDLPNERSCFDCEHALFGVRGTFCRLYAIDVWNEQEEAEGCEDYAP